VSAFSNGYCSAGTHDFISKCYNNVSIRNLCILTFNFLQNTQHQGVEQFRSALEMAPHNHSAYFGLASALLAWSRNCVTTGAFGWAASLLKVFRFDTSFLNSIK
jgi:hypothetical protein